MVTPTIILIIVVTRPLSRVIHRHNTHRRATSIRRLLFLLRTMLVPPLLLLMVTIIHHRGTILLTPRRDLYRPLWMTRRRVESLLVRRNTCIPV